MKSLLAARQKRKEEKILQEKERAEIEEATRNFLQHPQLFGGIQTNNNNNNRLRTSESMTDLDDDDKEIGQEGAAGEVSEQSASATDLNISYSSIDRNNESRGSLGYGSLSSPTPRTQLQQRHSLGATLRASLTSGMTAQSEHQHQQHQQMDYSRQTSSQSLQIQSSAAVSSSSLLLNSSGNALGSSATGIPQTRDMRKIESPANLTKLRAPNKGTRPYSNRNNNNNNNNASLSSSEQEQGLKSQKLMIRAPSKDTRPYQKNNQEATAPAPVEKNKNVATHRRRLSSSAQNQQPQQQQQQPQQQVSRGRADREPKRGNLPRTRSRSLSDLKVDRRSSKQQQQQVPETPRTARTKKMMRRASSRGMEGNNKTEGPMKPNRRVTDNNDNSGGRMAIPPFDSTPRRAPKKKISANKTNATNISNTPGGRMPKKKISSSSTGNHHQQQPSRRRTSSQDYVLDADNHNTNEAFDPFSSPTKKSKKKSVTTTLNQQHSLTAFDYQVVNVSSNNINRKSNNRREPSSRTLGSKDDSETAGSGAGSAGAGSGVSGLSAGAGSGVSSGVISAGVGSAGTGSAGGVSAGSSAWVPKTRKQSQRHSIGGSKRGSARDVTGQGTATTARTTGSAEGTPKQEVKAANTRKGREPKRGSLQRTRSRSLTDLGRYGGDSMQRQSNRKPPPSNNNNNNIRGELDDLDTNRRAVLAKQLSARRFEDNCVDTSPAKSPQRIYTTRKSNSRGVGDNNKNNGTDDHNQKLRTPSSSRRLRSDEDRTPSSILKKASARRGTKKPPQLGCTLNGEEESSDSDSEEEPPKRQSTPKSSKASDAKSTPVERIQQPLVSQSLHISPNNSLAGRAHAAASGWNIANKKQLKEWKTNLTSPNTSVTSMDAPPSSAPPKPKRRNSFTSVPSLASIHSRDTTFMPSLASVHSRDALLTKASSERFESGIRENPSVSTTPDRVLPTRDTNKTMNDHGRPDRMRELMPRTRSQSLNNLQATAYPSDLKNRASAIKARKMLTREQSHTIDNTGRPSRAPVRGMLQRTKSRSLTNLFSDMRHESAHHQSRPSALGHMRRQNSRQRLLKGDNNEDVEDEEPEKPLTVEQVNVGKKKKKLPNRQESEPSGLIHKKKLPKRQESEPSGLINHQGNQNASLEKKRQLIGSLDRPSNSQLQDYMRKEEPTTGRKGSSVVSGTLSTQSASTASSPGPHQKRGRAAPGKKRGVTRQRSRSLSDLVPGRGGRKKNPPLAAAATNNANTATSKDDTTALVVTNHAEGFAEAAFSLFSSMAVKSSKAAAPTTATTSTSALLKVQQNDTVSDNNDSSPSATTEAQGHGRGPRAPPMDRGMSRQRSSSLSKLQPRLQRPPLLHDDDDDTIRANRAMLSLSPTQEERDISRLKKKITMLQKELKSMDESPDIGCNKPADAAYAAAAATEGLDAQATYLISYFEAANDKERSQIRNLKEKMFDLNQENAKLEHGTEQTKKYYSELEAIDNAEVMKYDALLKNVPTFQGIVQAHEEKLDRRLRKIQFERKTARHYRTNMRSIAREFEAKCEDPELVRTLEELADL